MESGTIGWRMDKSIAWGIAKAFPTKELHLHFNKRGLLRRVTPCHQSVKSDLVFECDVGDPNSIDQLFDRIGQVWE